MTKKTFIIKQSTLKKGTVIRLNLLKFAGAIIIAIALIIMAVVIANQPKATVQVVEVEKEVPVTETIEVEKIIEVEKPVTETVIETVEVEKVVNVVDQDRVDALAQQLFTVYKDTYTVQINEETTNAAVEARFEALKNEYIAQADNAETARLAEEQAQTMFEEFKAQYIAETEAARVANVSIIKVKINFPQTPDLNFTLEIEGSLHDELTYDMIYNALLETGYLDTYKIDRIMYRDQPEVFIGRDYTSVRTINLKLK